jgi:hypothetical protein
VEVKARIPGAKTYVVPTKRKASTHVATLSAASPFVSVATIADMTLGDLTTVFNTLYKAPFRVQREKTSGRHECPCETRCRRFWKTLLRSPVVKMWNRLPQLAPSSKLPVLPGDNVDALQFCGAMRLFAGWQIIRQVPEGYKGYAVGMNIGRKDIVRMSPRSRKPFMIG